MRTIVAVCLRSLVERVLLWMRVWENPLSLLRCSSSGEPSALIGRLRAHGASVMHAPALVASLSLSLSLTRFLTGCKQCMTTIIFITSDMELISFSFFDHIHIITTSISFSSLHTAGCSLWLFCFPVFLETCFIAFYSRLHWHCQTIFFMGIFDTLNRLWIKLVS